MHHKGQIFSLDFIIAMTIIILFLALMINTAEIKTHEIKEGLLDKELQNKANSALLALSNGNYSCKMNNSNIAFSIDNTVLSSTSLTEIKEYLGLQKHKASIFIDNAELFSEEMGEEIFSVEVDVLECNNGISFSELQNCLEGSCGTQKKVLNIRVSR